METSERRTRFLAIAEVISVGLLYVVVARAAVAHDLFGASRWFPRFSDVEARIAGGVANGAIVQILLVACLAFLPGFAPVRRAIATFLKPAARPGWIIAVAVMVFDVIVLYAGWIGDFGKLFDTSPFGLSMSVVPAIDGVTQEIVFRGYVILRLAAAGVGRFWQIVLSGLLFGAIHFSYGQGFDPGSLASFLAALVPFAGTFGLGAAWALAFQASGYRLLPVVVSHVLVVLLVQPGLAMAYVGGYSPRWCRRSSMAAY